MGSKIWNNLPYEIKRVGTLSNFKKSYIQYSSLKGEVRSIFFFFHFIHFLLQHGCYHIKYISQHFYYSLKLVNNVFNVHNSTQIFKHSLKEKNMGFNIIITSICAQRYMCILENIVRNTITMGGSGVFQRVTQLTKLTNKPHYLPHKIIA